MTVISFPKGNPHHSIVHPVEGTSEARIHLTDIWPGALYAPKQLKAVYFSNAQRGIDTIHFMGAETVIATLDPETIENDEQLVQIIDRIHDFDLKV